MKDLRSILKPSIILGLALLLFVMAFIIKTEALFSTDLSSNPGIALRAPAFLKSAKAANLQQTDWEFILEEAGVTAYTAYKVNSLIYLPIISR